MTSTRASDELIPPQRSVDRVRVIRRSMRCFVLGLIGLVPLFGAAFACQALRLRRNVSLDLKDDWTPPPVYCYWLIGATAMMAGDALIGWAGDCAIGLALVALQSYHCWRTFRNRVELIWNPAERQLFLGVICAYAGLGLGLWMVVVLGLQIRRAIGSI
jgi:hypothetical protein